MSPTFIEMLAAAKQQTLALGLNVLAGVLGPVNRDWFDDTDYELWYEQGVQERLHVLVEWLLAREEGRA